MPVESQVDIHPAELTQIVATVFGAMMGLEATRCDLPPAPERDRLTAAVRLAGDWNGAVLFECSAGQACRLAGRFLAIDPPDRVNDLVRDVLCELANMIGGNLKCILRQGVSLSAPSIAADGGDLLRDSGTQVCERLAFRSPEGPFVISVVATPA